MRATAAEITVQRLFDLSIGGLGSFIEQGFRGHDHAVDAVAALRRLLINESLLNLVEFLGCAQTFYRGDPLVLYGADRRDTGTDRSTV